MREFAYKAPVIGAIITGFDGSAVVLTDDGDRLPVGSTWIGQNTPRVGDLITLKNGIYGLIRKSLIRELFVMPEPVDTWYLVDIDGKVLDEDGAGLTFTSLQDAEDFITVSCLCGYTPVPF